MHLSWTSVLSILCVTVTPLVLAVPDRLVVTGTGGAAVPADNEVLKDKVQKLLQQLESGSTTAQQAAAEWELLRLGPDVLPLLPRADAAPAGVKERVAQIAATLEELRHRVWNIDKTQIPLAVALDSLKKQTQMTLVDRRQAHTAVQVTPDFTEASYWQAALWLARQADARLSLYQPDGQVALVDGPAPLLPTALSGPFRVVLKRVSSSVDIEAQSHVGKLALEIAWEPRFRPFLIERGSVSFRTAKSDKHEAFATESPAHGPEFVAELNAKEFDVLFSAPPRSIGVLDDVTGRFVVTMPSKLLTFTFKAQVVAGVSQTEPGGAAVKVERIDLEADRWTVEISITVPAGMPKLDSFQRWLGSRSWLDQTTCQLDRLVDAKRQKLSPKPLWTNASVVSPTHVLVRFQFTADDGAKLQDFDKWRLVCSVPGRLVEMTVPFELHGIALP
jgi:hypothetical protein